MRGETCSGLASNPSRVGVRGVTWNGLVSNPRGGGGEEHVGERGPKPKGGGGGGDR